MPDSETEQNLISQSIENPQRVVSPNKISSSASNNKRLIIILVSFLLVLAIGAVVIYYLVKPNASLPVFLPVRLDHPAVKQAYIDYDFRVEVKDIKQETGGKRILTNLQEKEIPEFIIDKQTLIVVYENGRELPLPLPDEIILKGQKISIIARYYLSSDKWRVAKVTAYPSSISLKKPKVPNIATASGINR